jgi:hypothetical protein
VGLVEVEVEVVQVRSLPLPLPLLPSLSALEDELSRIRCPLRRGFFQGKTEFRCGGGGGGRRRVSVKGFRWGFGVVVVVLLMGTLRVTVVVVVVDILARASFTPDQLPLLPTRLITWESPQRR